MLHIAAPDGKHMTFRGSRSIEIGVFAVRRVAATAPLAELCAAATAHRPDLVYGYPSVLALMAEGRSNVTIARQLVVSDKAVEKHVSNIFTKLDLPPTDTDHRRVVAVLRWLEGGS